MIQVNDKIPNITMYRLNDQNIEAVLSHDLFKGRCVVFGLPGAFTKICSSIHAPGFIEHVAKFKEIGIDHIFCIAVNDVFVMDAWAKTMPHHEAITFISDGNGELTNALGLSLDLSHIGLGKRSLRYAMLLNDGIVTHLEVEEAASTCAVSSALGFLDKIR